MSDMIEVSIWDHRDLNRSISLARRMIDTESIFGAASALEWFDMEGAKVVESLADDDADGGIELGAWQNEPVRHFRQDII